MTSQLKIESTLAYPMTQLADMHNLSFADYYVPFDLSAEQLADFCRIYHIDLHRSIVLRTEDGEFVGQARLAFRGTRAWCGGLGIAVAFRGQGLAHRLVDEMVASARAAGATLLQLEVLAQNERARKTYERAGFVTQRLVTGFALTGDLLAERATETQIAIESLAPEVVLGEQLARQAAPQTWQREPATLVALSLEGSRLHHPDGSDSSLAIQRNGPTLSVLAASLSETLTPAGLAGWLTLLLSGEARVRVHNEPVGTRLHGLCRDLGAEVLFEQHEMHLSLRL